MLTQTADHALRALLAIARQGGDRPLRVEEIAAMTGAPRNYLGKTLGALVKAGLLRSTRGPQGGFVLRIPPDELRLARLVELFDPPRERRICLLGGRPCTDSAPCQAHFRWKAIHEAGLGPLRDTTVADLLGG